MNPPDVLASPQVRTLPDAGVLQQMYRTMLLSRALDVRMFALNRQGRVPFMVPCQGHEGAQAGMVAALRPGRDFFALYYRDLTAALAIGATPRDIMLGVFARADDPACAGRQMPEHLRTWLWGNRLSQPLRRWTCLYTGLLGPIRRNGHGSIRSVRGHDAG